MSRDAIKTLTSSLPLATDQAHTSVTGTDYGNKRALDANLLGPKTAFGELLTAQQIPKVQIDGLYGIKATDVITGVGPSGTATTKTDHGAREFECTTGTTSGGYGSIRSRRSLRYRPGEGAAALFTARYTAGIADSSLRAGLLSRGTSLTFGYEGTEFGILYKTSGRSEIRTLTITTQAAGAETATVTLDGTAYSVALTLGVAALDTIQHTCWEISIDPDFIAGGWEAFQKNDTVVFIKTTTGPLTGAFTFASDGVAVGTFAQTAAGTADVDTFIAQADWNTNPLKAGNFILDPTKGNVFKITFQYLGYGPMSFFVEDPVTGNLIVVHVIQYANENIAPSLDVPIFQLGWIAESQGSTTDIAIYGGSGAGFVQGKQRPFRNPTGHGNSKLGVTTALTNILSIRNKSVVEGFTNFTEILPELIFVAVDGNKPAQVELHLNATIGGEPDWRDHFAANTNTEVDTAGTTVAEGTEIAVATVARAGSIQLDLQSLRIVLARNDVLTIAVRATATTTDVSASFTWLED